MHWAGLVIAAYLIGSIPMGLIFGKLIWKKDLRRFGSHNIGATNAWRILGRKAGLLIFILDFLKGQLGVLLGAYLFASPGAMVVGGLFAVFVRFNFANRQLNNHRRFPKFPTSHAASR